MQEISTRRSIVTSITAAATFPNAVWSRNQQGSSGDIDLKDSITGSIIGDSNAPVTMHIYNDFQSNYGRDFYFETVPFIFEDFVHENEVLLVFHDFPRLGTDPEIADPDDLLVELSDPRNESSLAAQAAMSAGEQGKYLHMCDRLFGSYQDVQSGTFFRKNLNRMALAIELDIDLFDESMDSGRHLQELAKSIEQGWAYGITATPMFILDNGTDEPATIQNTSEGYALIKRQIELAVDTAR